MAFFRPSSAQIRAQVQTAIQAWRESSRERAEALSTLIGALADFAEAHEIGWWKRHQLIRELSRQLTASGHASSAAAACAVLDLTLTHPVPRAERLRRKARDETKE